MVEVIGLRSGKKISDDLIQAHKEKITTLEEMVANQEKILEVCKEQVDESAEALKAQTEAVTIAKKIIEEYKVELDKVRKQRDFWRKTAMIGTGTAVVVGAIIGFLVGKN